jgi:hypothetical protein
MATNVRKRLSYGLSDALIGISAEHTVSTRNPTTADLAPLGHMWVNRAANTVFFCSQLANQAAVWSQAASVAGNLTAGGTITAGTGLIASAGGVTATGNSTITGTLTTSDQIVVSANGVDVTGNSAITGTLTVSSTITSTAGNIIATAGTIRSVLGNIEATFGNIVATEGDIIITHDTNALVVGGAGELASNGDNTVYTCAANGSFAIALGDAAGVNIFEVVDSGLVTKFFVNSDGEIEADANVRIGSEDKGGSAGTTTFTGIGNASAISTGVGSIKMTTVNAADNAGFIKIYIGNTEAWIPYFTAEVS